MPTDKEFLGTEDIPEPFKLRSWKDYIKFLIGPGIIAMGLGLGTGEIVSGPFLVVKHGPFILWVALISMLLQTLTAVIASKYTILTGEPFQLGINRLWISKKAWTIVWLVLGGISIIFPYYMALLGVTMVAMVIQSVPTAADQGLWVILTLIALVITIIPLFLGKKVMRTLAMMFFLLHFIIVIPMLIIITIIFVPADVIWTVFTGFFTFGYVPPDADWLAMGAVAGFAGLAASAGIPISSYYRDTGWGMADKVGYIPGAVGGGKTKFKTKGYLPKSTPENHKRAKKWYKYIKMELIPVFFLGSFFTMLFPCALYYYFVPQTATTDANIFGFTAALAQSMGPVLPFAFWIILIMLFIVFWPDGTGVVEGQMRSFANILWNAFPGLEKKFNGDIRPVYYGILAIFTGVWILMILTGTPPVTMVLISGSLANIGGVIFAIGLLGVNYLILPKDYRFSKIEIVIIFLSLGFFSFFMINAMLVPFGISL